MGFPPKYGFFVWVFPKNMGFFMGFSQKYGKIWVFAKNRGFQLFYQEMSFFNVCHRYALNSCICFIRQLWNLKKDDSCIMITLVRVTLVQWSFCKETFGYFGFMYFNIISSGFYAVWASKYCHLTVLFHNKCEITLKSGVSMKDEA